MKRKDWFSFKF